MRYLHTMVRVRDLDASLDFYCNKLGLAELSRVENAAGRFTLVFLCAPGDEEMAKMFAAHLTKVERQLAARPNCEVLYVDHRTTLNSPQAVATQVNRFLDHRLDVEKMTAVVDQQLYRNRAR